MLSMCSGTVVITDNMYSAGAAGNFLAPITQLSANAFKSVIDIDVLGMVPPLRARSSTR